MRDPARRRNVHVLHVCTKCRRPGADAPEGRLLYELVKAQLAAAGELPPVRLNGVECLSGCNHACTFAIAAPGKPTWFFGEMAPEAEQAAAILALAAAYRHSEDGALARADWPADWPNAAILLSRMQPHAAE